MTLALFRAEVLTKLATAVPRFSPYESDKVNPPCGELIIGGGTFRTDFSKSVEYVGAIRVYAGRTAEVAAQKALDELIDVASVTDISTALEDATWTNAQWVKVVGFTGPTAISVEGQNWAWLTVDFNLEFCI